MKYIFKLKPFPREAISLSSLAFFGAFGPFGLYSIGFIGFLRSFCPFMFNLHSWKSISFAFFEAFALFGQKGKGTTLPFGPKSEKALKKANEMDFQEGIVNRKCKKLRRKQMKPMK